jgi:protein gp37
MRPEWVESIRRDALRQKVPFFFKQWGAWGPDGVRRSKKVNGRELSGRTWDELPA